MKKNILYSLLISTVATVGLSSCDAFLEENPKDQITEEQAYQNSTLLYLNHIHLPDPIFEDIKVLQQENTELTNRVLELEGELRQMRKKERTEQK